MMNMQIITGYILGILCLITLSSGQQAPSTLTQKKRNEGHLRYLQQTGSQVAEKHPSMDIRACTVKEGCKLEQASVTLDANWRWLHENHGFTNCYTGNSWNSQLCPDGPTCSSNCALEGNNNQYASTYGITTPSNDALALQFVTGTNVGSRTYLLEDENTYKMFRLKNREFTFTVDNSQLPCGLNGALYFVSMDSKGGINDFDGNNAGAKYGTGYCDAQCPHDIKFINGEANVENWAPSNSNSGKGKYGSCCHEMDIWESNSISTAFTPHVCTQDGQYRCEGTECGDNDSGERYDGVCDKDGCDFNPYRMGDKNFYGPSAQFTIDSSKPITVVTQFITDDGTDSGNLSEIRRKWIQDGIVYDTSTVTVGGQSYNSITDEFCNVSKEVFEDTNDFAKKGGLKKMGDAFDQGMVLVMSLWDDYDVNMLWLDSNFPLDKDPSKPGVARGTCPTDSGVPAEVEANHPHATVTYSDIRYGEIDSTYNTNPSTKSPVTMSTVAPTSTTTKADIGEGFCSYDNCQSVGGSEWCRVSQSRCEGNCNGKWCAGVSSPTGNDDSSTTSQTSTAPSDSEDAGFCSYDSCQSVGGSEWCRAAKNNCEGSCDGTWCASIAEATGYATKSACDKLAPATTTSWAYHCMDWNVGSYAMSQAAIEAGVESTHFFGVGSFGDDASNMGKCYEVTIAGSAKKGIFQVINQGGDVELGQFDLQMGDGGFGLNNQCVEETFNPNAPAMFGGSQSDWGRVYGGWDNRKDCARLPDYPQFLGTDNDIRTVEPTLVELCQVGFDLGVRLEGGANPVITNAERIPCPLPLVKLTGLDRTDGQEKEVHTKQGKLTRMMDCCKPSGGWIGNVEHASPEYPAVNSCASDGFTRLVSQSESFSSTTESVDTTDRQTETTDQPLEEKTTAKEPTKQPCLLGIDCPEEISNAQILSTSLLFLAANFLYL